MLGPTPKYFRASERHPSWVKVTIFGDEGKPVKGVIENVSFGGLYVDTDEVEPRLGKKVKLEISLFDKGHFNKHQMQAEVAHVEFHGAGLAFDQYDPDTVNALRSVMAVATRH